MRITRRRLAVTEIALRCREAADTRTAIVLKPRRSGAPRRGHVSGTTLESVPRFYAPAPLSN